MLSLCLLNFRDLLIKGTLFSKRTPNQLWCQSFYLPWRVKRPFNLGETAFRRYFGRLRFYANGRSQVEWGEKTGMRWQKANAWAILLSKLQSKKCVQTRKCVLFKIYVVFSFFGGGGGGGGGGRERGGEGRSIFRRSARSTSVNFVLIF